MSTPGPRIPSSDGHYEPEIEGAGKQLDLATGTLAYLLAGPLGFGLIGLVLDRWLQSEFLLPVGVVVGMALSLYVIWLRYGRS